MIDPTDLCYRCGLPEDECDCDRFIRDDDDEDQYTDDIPREEDLIIEEDELEVVLNNPYPHNPLFRGA